MYVHNTKTSNNSTFSPHYLVVNLLSSRNVHTRRQANTLLPRSSSTIQKPSSLPFVNTRWWSHLPRKEANPWLNVKELSSYMMHTWSENTSFSSWTCKWHCGSSVIFVLFVLAFILTIYNILFQFCWTLLFCCHLFSSMAISADIGVMCFHLNSILDR